MVIQHNLQAMFTNRQLGITGRDKSKSQEKLASGYKINRAADNAAGLQISEKMRKQISGLTRGEENVNDGISYCQVADGALSEIHDMLGRLKELSVQAANGTNSPSDRAAINDEVIQIKNEMNRIFSTTTFNGERIWDDDKIYEPEMEWVKEPVPTIEYTKTGVIIPNTEVVSIPQSLPTSGSVSGSGSVGWSQSSYSYTYNITNDNKMTWPADYGFRINADNDGYCVKWKGFDGVSYESDKVTWPEPLNEEGRTVSFSLADNLTHYTDADEQKKLAGVNAKFSFTTTKYTTKEDLINSLNNNLIYTDYYDSAKLALYDSNGNNVTGSASGIHNPYAYFYHSAVLVSDMNLKDKNDPANTSGTVSADTDFIRPDDFNGATSDDKVFNLIEEPYQDGSGNWKGTWKFTFNMKNIGKVTATVSSISCVKHTANTGNDSDPDRDTHDAKHDNRIGHVTDGFSSSRDKWWGWDYTTRYDRSTQKSYYNGFRANEREITAPTNDVNGVISLLTEASSAHDSNKNINGLLGDADGNNSDTGEILFQFALKSDASFGPDGSPKSTAVGSMSFIVNVPENEPGETVAEQVASVINRIKMIDGADFYTGDENSNREGKLSSVNSGVRTRFYKNSVKRSVEELVDATVYTTKRVQRQRIDEYGNPVFNVVGKWKDLNVHTLSEADMDVKISLAHRNLDVEILGMKDMNTLSISKAEEAIGLVDKAGKIISEERSRFGAYQNRLEHTQKINLNAAENTTSAESRIRDTDMAKEMQRFSTINILEQAGQSMLSQANQSANGVMALLQ